MLSVSHIVAPIVARDNKSFHTTPQYKYAQRTVSETALFRRFPFVEPPVSSGGSCEAMGLSKADARWPTMEVRRLPVGGLCKANREIDSVCRTDCAVRVKVTN